MRDGISGVRYELMGVHLPIPELTEIKVTETQAPPIERAHGMFLKMALIRAFDEAAGEARRDGRAIYSLPDSAMERPRQIFRAR